MWRLAGWLALVGCEGDFMHGVDDVPLRADCADGEVWFDAANGASTRLTEAFAQGEVVTLVRDGVVEFCPGEYPSRVVALAHDLRLVGVEGPEATWLAGDGGRHGVGAGSRLVVGPLANVEVVGLGLRGGHASRGGGVEASGGSPGRHIRLENVRLEGNVATKRGGGVHVEGGTIHIVDSRLTQNSAHGGGALYTRDADVHVESTVVSGNTAEEGGGLRMFGGHAELANVDILDNLATDRGAGVSVEWGMTATGSAVVLRGNVSASRGGGAWVDDDATLLLYDSVVEANEAGTGGAIYVKHRAHVTFQRTRVWSNQAQRAGGAYVDDDAVFESMDSDWGAGANDNLPEDVWMDCGGSVDAAEPDFVVIEEDCSCS